MEPLGTRLRRPGVALAVVLHLALASGTSAAPGVTVRASGCVEAVALLSVEAARVRPLVTPFTPLEPVPGQALVGVAVAECERLAVGGRASAPGSFSDVGVAIERPDGAPEGTHYAQLWQVTDRRDLRAAMAGLGLAGGHADVDLSVSPSGADATVGWAAASYGVSVTAAGAAAPSGPSTTYWWHVGRRGRLAVVYALGAADVRAGVAEVVAPPESRLGRVVAGAARGAGLVIVLSGFRAEASYR